MKFKTMMLTAAVGVAVSAIAEPARAFTFSTSTNAPTGFLPGSQVIDFDSPSPGVTVSGGATIPNSIDGVAAQPAGATGNYLTVGPSGFSAGPATISLGTLASYYGLYWGSVDGYNTLEFLRDGAVIAGGTFGGALFPPADGNQGSGVYVNFFASSAAEYFNGVRLTSTSFAFESDNHAFQAIPTPALLPGLIGMGLAALRKRKGEQEAEA